LLLFLLHCRSRNAIRPTRKWSEFRNALSALVVRRFKVKESKKLIGQNFGFLERTFCGEVFLTLQTSFFTIPKMLSHLNRQAFISLIRFRRFFWSLEVLLEISLDFFQQQTFDVILGTSFWGQARQRSILLKSLKYFKKWIFFVRYSKFAWLFSQWNYYNIDKNVSLKLVFDDVKKTSTNFKNWNNCRGF
jgi:hypothetical protein